jgi:hypothetical protein
MNWKRLGRMQMRSSSRYRLPHWTEKSHDKPVTIINPCPGWGWHWAPPRIITALHHLLSVPTWKDKLLHHLWLCCWHHTLQMGTVLKYKQEKICLPAQIPPVYYPRWAASRFTRLLLYQRKREFSLTGWHKSYIVAKNGQLLKVATV